MLGASLSLSKRRGAVRVESVRQLLQCVTHGPFEPQDDPTVYDGLEGSGISNYSGSIVASSGNPLSRARSITVDTFVSATS